jgi:hypothetical protein
VTEQRNGGRGYADDPTIRDDANLLRRISPNHFVFDETRGVVRPSSAAFADHPNGSPMSVVLAEVVRREGRLLESLLSNFPGYALASITARVARECGQAVCRDPLPDESGHAVVFGTKSRAVKRRMAQASAWEIWPPT